MRLFKNAFTALTRSGRLIRSGKFISKASEVFYLIARLSRYANIRVRLLVFFILLSSVPLFVLGFVTYSRSSSAVEEKVKSFSSEIAGQSSQNIRNSMRFVETNLKEIQNNKSMMEVINNFDQGIAAEQDLYDALYDTLAGKFTSATLEGCIGVCVISKGQYYLPSFTTQMTDFVGNETEYSKLAEKANGRPVWINVKGNASSSNYTLSLFEICNQASGSPLLTVVVFFDESYLHNMIDGVNIDGSSNLFIMDSKGIVISAKTNKKDSKQLPTYTTYFDKDVIEGVSIESKKLLASIDKKEIATKVVSGSFQTKSNEYLVSFSNIKDTDWSVIGTIPTSYIKEYSTKILTTILTVSFVIFFLAIIISLFISSSISVPLKKLKTLMNEARNGNLSIGIKDKYNDEISNVSNDFDDMVRNIRDLVSKVSVSSKNVLDSSEKVSGLSSVFHTTAEQVAESMQQIANGASEQAENNYKSLEFVNILSNDINKVGSDVGIVSGIIHDTKSLSENALIAVKSLNEKSIQTSKVSDDIVNNINTLNVDMKEIQKIVKFIGTISDQTNMLSLNAAIEAARAGEAGKGFAVVAENVRKLADQTKEALSTISKVIKNIDQKAQLTVISASNTQEIVKQQMSAVNQTDSSFKAIFDSLENISKFMDGFEVSVNNILQSGHKTLEAINNISAVSEETAATVEEVTATAEHQIAGVEEVADQSKLLNELAQELNKSISIFRV